MYSDAFDKVKVIDFTKNDPINISGWRSICLEVYNAIDGDIQLASAETETGNYINLHSEEVKRIVKNPVTKEYDVEDGIKVREEEVGKTTKRLILNTLGKAWLKIINHDGRLILARPSSAPQL